MITPAAALRRRRRPPHLRAQIDMIMSPSRYDRPLGTLATCARRNHKLAAVVLWTEVAHPDRAQVLADLPGVSVAQQRKGARGLAECAITVDDTVWELVRWASYEIGPDLGPGDVVNAVVALLRHRATGLTLLVWVAHMPSAVEGSWRERVRRVTEYVKAVVRLRKILREWSRLERPDGVAGAADWNLSLRKAWVRAWASRTFPGLKVADPARAADQRTAWTHAGGRLIDWFLTWGIRRPVAQVMGPDDHSDHRRTLLRGVLTSRRWRRWRDRRKKTAHLTKETPS